MIKRFELPAETCTTPEGIVNKNEPCWEFKNKMRWDARLRTSVLEDVVEDREHYNELINGHFQVFTKDTCRNCKKKIRPYKTKYYRLHIEDGFKISVLFSQENCYCEKCAREKSQTIISIRSGCAVESRRQRQEFGSEYLEEVVYEDGSTLNEMTYQEKVAVHMK
ncbi:MAG: hypothetical protein J6W46_07375 [Spirochaetaceae bacterium]|nr:hypothetical protein [Spirochaetaceae bacterium]